MSLSSLRVLILTAFVPALAATVFAQQSNPPAANPPQAGATQGQPPAAQPAATPASTAAAENEASKDDVDRYYSLTAVYMQMLGHPTLAGGASFVAPDASVLHYTGSNRDALSGTLIVPLPSHSDLNLTYFRYSGSGAQTLSLLGVSYLGTVYAQGDYLAPSYTAQGGKLSYEYLTLPWPLAKHKLRLYTLYSVEYFNMKTVIDAPFKTITTDSSGNVISNIASGGRMIIYPSFGAKVEYPLSKAVRLEASASGFGIPKHADIWDADANASVHITRTVDFVLGVRSFYFKTSPQSDEYFHQLTYGAYGGFRYTLR